MLYVSMLLAWIQKHRLPGLNFILLFILLYAHITAAQAEERPYPFFRLPDFLPVIDPNGVITEQEEFQALFADEMAAPTIDFERFFVAYQQVFAGGCSVITVHHLHGTDTTMTYLVELHSYGSCDMGYIENAWILIPRSFLSRQISFRAHVIKQP